MINRKVFGSALAIAIFSAFVVAADPVEDALEYSARVVAEITDGEGVPVTLMPGEVSSRGVTEELVEGHTVFTTVDLERGPPEDLMEVNIDGFVDCRYSIQGLAIPSLRFDRVWAECNVGGQVYVTNDTTNRPMSRDALDPTGWEVVIKRPDTGEGVLVKEYAYPTTRTTEDGGTEVVEAYCWETSLVEPGVNPFSGLPFNFVTTANWDRFVGGNTETVRILPANEFFLVSR